MDLEQIKNTTLDLSKKTGIVAGVATCLFGLSPFSLCVNLALGGAMLYSYHNSDKIDNMHKVGLGLVLLADIYMMMNTIVFGAYAFVASFIVLGTYESIKDNPKALATMNNISSFCKEKMHSLYQYGKEAVINAEVVC